MTLIHSWCSLSDYLCGYKDTFIVSVYSFAKGEKNFTVTPCWDEFWKFIPFMIIYFAGTWRTVLVTVVVQKVLFYLQFLVQMAINEFCDWLYPDFIFSAITLTFKFSLCCQICKVFFFYAFFFPVASSSEKVEICNIIFFLAKNVLVVFLDSKSFLLRFISYQRVWKG